MQQPEIARLSWLAFYDNVRGRMTGESMFKNHLAERIASGGRAAFTITVILFTLAACQQFGPGTDFNGDGAADLAIGMPFRDAGEVVDAGAVALVLGNAESHTPSGGEIRVLQRLPASIEPDPESLQAVARRSDRLGASLMASDFNSDGLADLAIGVPFEDRPGYRDAGAVTVVYGDRKGGLQAGSADNWHQDSGTIKGDPEDNDLFGYALATEDFNADGFPDLAVGVPFDNLDGIANGGAISVIYGSFLGLSDQRNQILNQKRLGIQVQQPNALFGSSLAAGDFDGDGIGDLAVGAPDESYDGVRQAGAVSVIYGGSSGLSTSDHTVWRQSDRFVMGGDLNNEDDNFGTALAAADFNGDGHDDLAIGTPRDNWGGKRDSGTVNVLYSAGSAGITADKDQIWHQNLRRSGLTNEDEHHFGAALAGGDFNGDGFADLAVGIPGQRRDFETRVGAVYVAYGSEQGLRVEGSQVWQEGIDGINGLGEGGDEFGSSLKGVDLNGDGFDDLAIGAKGDRAGSVDKAGGVFILFGSETGLQSFDHEVWHANSGGMDEAETQALFGAALTGVAGLPKPPPEPEVMEDEEMMEDSAEDEEGAVDEDEAMEEPSGETEEMEMTEESGDSEEDDSEEGEAAQ